MKALPRKSDMPLESHCDFCNAKPPILIDAPTRLGPWAHMCEECYQCYGIEGPLGTTHTNRVKEDEPS